MRVAEFGLVCRPSGRGVLGRLDAQSFLSRRGLLGAGLALSGGLAGCGASSAISLNVKLTFFLDEGGQRSLHSGVWRRVEQSVSAFPNSGNTVVTSLFGDAIPVRLSNGRYLFAMLVTGDVVPPEALKGLWQWDCRDLLERGYGINLEWAGGDNSGLRQLAANPSLAPIELPMKRAPAFITFDDLTRPETGQIIDPGDLSGLGVGRATISHAAVQVVSQPVGRGLARILPWLSAGHTQSNEMSAWDDFGKHPKYFSR